MKWNTPHSLRLSCLFWFVSLRVHRFSSFIVQFEFLLLCLRCVGKESIPNHFVPLLIKDRLTCTCILVYDIYIYICKTVYPCSYSTQTWTSVQHLSHARHNIHSTSNNRFAEVLVRTKKITSRINVVSITKTSELNRDS